MTLHCLSKCCDRCQTSNRPQTSRKRARNLLESICLESRSSPVSDLHINLGIWHHACQRFVAIGLLCEPHSQRELTISVPDCGSKLMLTAALRIDLKELDIHRIQIGSLATALTLEVVAAPKDLSEIGLGGLLVAQIPAADFSADVWWGSLGRIQMVATRMESFLRTAVIA